MRRGAGTTTRAPSKEYALQLFAGLPHRYDAMAALLSLGQEPRWRRTMVGAVEASPTDRVLDVATGTGLVASELVHRFGCSVVGLDQSAEMLSRARERLRAEPALGERIELVPGEAERLPFADGEFDHLTFAHLLRYLADPADGMRELARVVRPGGRIAALDFGLPDPPVWRALWRLYTRIGLPLLGGLVSRDWYEVGRFLEPSISGFYERYPLPRLAEIWSGAGIRAVRVRRMSAGGGIVIWGVRDGG